MSVHAATTGGMARPVGAPGPTLGGIQHTYPWIEEQVKKARGENES